MSSETTQRFAIARAARESFPGSEYGCIRRSELQPGDRLLVTTRNSVYSIWVWGDDRFAVSGGWYEKQGRAAEILGINGCTWGGSAICTSIVAAPGLCLEFEDKVTTTRIQRVRLTRGEVPLRRQ